MTGPTLPTETVDHIIMMLDVKSVLAGMMRVNSLFHSLAEKRLYYEVQFTTSLDAYNETLCDTLMRRASAARAVRIARIRLTFLDDRMKELIPKINIAVKQLVQLTTLDLFLKTPTWKVVDGVGHTNLSTIILGGTCEKEEHHAIKSLLKSSNNVRTLCDFRQSTGLFDLPLECLPNIKEIYGRCALSPGQPSAPTLVSVTIFDIWKGAEISSLTSLMSRFNSNLECFRAVVEWKTGTVSKAFSALNPLTLRELCLRCSTGTGRPSESELIQDLVDSLPQFTNLRVLELPEPYITDYQSEGNKVMQVDGVTGGFFSDGSTALNYLQTLAPALEVMRLSTSGWKLVAHSSIYVPEGSFVAGLPLGWLSNEGHT